MRRLPPPKRSAWNKLTQRNVLVSSGRPQPACPEGHVLVQPWLCQPGHLPTSLGLIFFIYTIKELKSLYLKGGTIGIWGNNSLLFQIFQGMVRLSTPTLQVLSAGGDTATQNAPHYFQILPMIGDGTTSSWKPLGVPEGSFHSLFSLSRGIPWLELPALRFEQVWLIQ